MWHIKPTLILRTLVICALSAYFLYHLWKSTERLMKNAVSLEYSMERAYSLQLPSFTICPYYDYYNDINIMKTDGKENVSQVKFVSLSWGTQLRLLPCSGMYRRPRETLSSPKRWQGFGMNLVHLGFGVFSLRPTPPSSIRMPCPNFK